MPVDPLNLIVIPLTLALAALFAIAAAYDFIIFRRRKKNGSKTIYRCDTCRHIYTAPGRTPLARCPKCGKQNEPVRA
jgi:hypothetical protein